MAPLGPLRQIALHFLGDLFYQSKHLKGQLEPPVSDEICVSRKIITSSQLEPPVSDKFCVSLSLPVSWMMDDKADQVQSEYLRHEARC